MAQKHDETINTIGLMQKWLAGKIEIGTEFQLEDSDNLLQLISCDGYPNGKLIFEDGEEFNPGKYPKVSFIQNIKEEEQQELDFYEEIDRLLNGKIEIDENGKEKRIPLKPGDEEESIIRTTLAPPQKNESYHAMNYYDVTDIIKQKNDNPISDDLPPKLYENINDNGFPVLTKDKLHIIFSDCELKPTKSPDFIRIIRNNEDIGYLGSKKGLYIFAPKNKRIQDEYKFENNKATGFFYTAENYLDIALSTIERYKEQFVPFYNTTLDKSKQSYGYQADASIKTLLAFSCECYLKSLIINDGKELSNIKGLGHGLSVLFTSLSDEMVAKVFSYMERNGYNLKNPMYSPVFETNDLTEQFMLDLARVDDAFIDARYSAENDKNTDYSFLYRFALALRHCSKKEFSISSPFDTSISSKTRK